MNIPRLVTVAVTLCSAAPAQESRSATVVPQPRVRLDPVTRAAVPAASAKVVPESFNAAVMMSPMVVKSTPILVEDPEQPPQPRGPFSLLGGGAIWTKDHGRARMEVGFWPYQNIFWRSEKFKSERNHVGTELVRISW